MGCTALVPVGIHQQCAMASIASVENRRATGKKLGELAYAKAFFKTLTGKSQISSTYVRKFDASYDPSCRGGSTKMDYIRALDILIESRGEKLTLPLSWDLAVNLFPGLQNRLLQRREHRDRIHDQRVERKTDNDSNLLNLHTKSIMEKSRGRLSFCRPGQHKLWLEDWHNDIHGQGLSTHDIYLMLRDWWSSFWITTYRNDYIWCSSLTELLNEIDYVLSIITSMEFNVCLSALPLRITFKAG